ncbi:MAG: hypothetical protein WDZ79_01540 [Candidatus Paceibacterota bacterium]
METINTILKTEKEAEQIVEDARHERGRAIEQARSRQRDELERYREELAREREEALASVEKETAATARSIQEEQKKEQATIEESAHAHRDAAVKKLLDTVASPSS